MEGKEHHKELKTSSNEEESSEQAVACDDSSGTSAPPGGRYYECIFCRRGFSTAQALGGHMNIHRRERPKIRPAAAPLAKREESYHPYMKEMWHPPTAAATENYFVYFPGSSSNVKEAKEEDMEIDDLDLELRLGHGGGHKRP